MRSGAGVLVLEDEGGLRLAGGLGSDRPQCRRGIEAGHREQRLVGGGREHRHLLAQMAPVRPRRRQLRPARGDAAQPGLHPERRGDVREVKRHDA
jgi:hypothetical protein